MTILIVDDAPDVRFMLRVVLEDAGMEVEESGSGQAALHRLADPAGIDAVVLDQRMPGITGLEVARELEQAGAGHPPLVLFSAYLHPSLQAEADDLGLTTVDKTDILGLVDVLRSGEVIAA
jgi:CheY-like chemotaxis protein